MPPQYDEAQRQRRRYDQAERPPQPGPEDRRDNDGHRREPHRSHAPFESALIISIVAVFILLQREDLRDRLIRLFGSAICTARRWRWDDTRPSS